MNRLPNAWLSRTISQFVLENDNLLLGELVSNSSFSVEMEQRNAWSFQISFLKSVLVGLDGMIYFELTVPRIGTRIDIALILNDRLFVIECKVGSDQSSRSAKDQAWDYALDLKNFHEASHHIEIIPLELPTNWNGSETIPIESAPDLVWPPIAVSQKNLRGIIDQHTARSPLGDKISTNWASSSYKPTPTIVEAARNLYGAHSVHEILRNDAGAQNISETSKQVEAIIEQSRKTHEKAICFVTGVPGAGKTLVGLNIATRHEQKHDKAHSVFLSGNGPLVKVLIEALTRDQYEREKTAGKRPKKSEIRRTVGAFIQNVHHFRDEGLRSTENPPADHVVIFDEAQRAWNHKKTVDFMQRKKGISGFDQSEAEFLISYMNRHIDWAVIICLVGGGQEIHDGEAGIRSWIEAIENKFPSWNVHISDQLMGLEYQVFEQVKTLNSCGKATIDRSLHLSSSMRSFRAENVSSFVKALLDKDINSARKEIKQFTARYPVVVTRDIDTAKKWIKKRARGSERVGLLASSKAQRLKPHAIDVRVEIDPIHYFLNSADDVRSSSYLEDAATEFQVQGLELDWALVTWDGDLSMTNGSWSYRQFRGSKWMNIHKPENQVYLLNAYRVLLTRARQGMAIFMPCGETDDHTRPESIYNGTFEHLVSCGIEVI